MRGLLGLLLATTATTAHAVQIPIPTAQQLAWQANVRTQHWHQSHPKLLRGWPGQSAPGLRQSAPGQHGDVCDV